MTDKELATPTPTAIRDRLAREKGWQQMGENMQRACTRDVWCANEISLSMLRRMAAVGDLVAGGMVLAEAEKDSSLPPITTTMRAPTMFDELAAKELGWTEAAP